MKLFSNKVKIINKKEMGKNQSTIKEEDEKNFLLNYLLNFI
jgi:hypothetical protein